MSAARDNVHQRSVGRNDAALKALRMLFGAVLAAALAWPTTAAVAQDVGSGSSGGGVPMPKFSIGGGEQKRKLTPEEEERQKQIDADYKAATKKIPDQKAPDPWADVRGAPASGQKAPASTQNASAQKKKQSAQQAQ